MPTSGEILQQVAADREALATAKRRLSHADTYRERRQFLKRIRELEDHLRLLYARYLKAEGRTPATIFGTRKKPRVYAGLAVRMDMSDDGLFFSNPGPHPAHGQRIWVRTVIDIAQKAPFSTVKTVIPDVVHVTWVIPKGWVSLDVYPKFGRIEYMASIPLIVTREFHAPSSGSTSGNKFGAYVDPYYSIEPQGGGEPSGSAIVTESDIIAHLEAGTYRFYSRSANVLDSATDHAIADSDWSVAESDEHLYYTDGATYLNVRLILSGPYAGEYIIVGQDGITLTDLTGEDPG